MLLTMFVDAPVFEFFALGAEKDVVCFIIGELSYRIDVGITPITIRDNRYMRNNTFINKVLDKFSRCISFICPDRLRNNFVSPLYFLEFR